MLRPALACCALLACTGSPPEDRRAPAQAPIAPTEPADAAPPDAPSAPCFAIPFTADAERAGIRRVAHRVPPPSNTKPPHVRDVVKLAVGKQTVVQGLRVNRFDNRYGQQPTPPPIRVPAVANADGMIVRSELATGKVTVNALPYLEGAVVEVAAEGFALVAIGDAGVATLARYREHYVKPRLAATPFEGDDKVVISPLAVMLDDLDGDGVLEQVSFSRVSFRPKTLTKGMKIRDSELELGVLWSTGELASVRTCCDAFQAPGHYVVAPTLSGGNVLLVSTDGDRVVLDGKTLTKLPQAQGAAAKRCLQTSTTEPATIVAVP